MGKCYKRSVIKTKLIMEKGVEFIKDKKENIVAIIIYRDYQKDGVEFFTPDNFSQQLALISHKTGHIIEAHTHNIVKRDIHLTQETLFIKKGKLKVNFYDRDKNYFDSRVLRSGDTILLADGGHGFEILEDVDMIEVKQGPYLSDKDKSRFKGVEDMLKI